MHVKTFIGVLIGLLLIGLLLWLGIYAYQNIIISGAVTDQVAQTQPTAAMTAFLIAKPNLVVDGSALSKVEIWYVPTGNAVSEADYRFVGNAVLQPDGDPATQIWNLPIPSDQFLATEVFVKGFDTNGLIVGRLSLPYTGATQIYDALWAGTPPPTSSTPGSNQRHFSFTLKVGEKTTVGGLAVKLVKIESDSRCPTTAVCIWAGEVAAQVELTSGVMTKTVSLHTMGSGYVFNDAYQIAITGVGPARSGTPPAQSAYSVTFSVERL